MKRNIPCSTLIAGAALAAAALAGDAQAQALALATDRPGTTFNAIGTGMAKAMTAGSKMNIVVRPYAGPATWMPLLDSGEVRLGVASANSVWQAYHGKGEVKKPLRNFRILRSGSGSLMLGFIVPAKSDIRTLKDLKGKRVASHFGGHVSIPASVAATLATAGYTWDDVVQVPVVGAVDGINAITAGRVDATWASLGQPQVREAHQKFGIRYLSMINTPEALQTFRKMLFPAVQYAVAPINASPGVEPDTTLITYDAYLVGHKDLPAEQVNALLGALWDRTDELMKGHRGLSGFKRDRAVTDAAVAPYHEAAVAFYKSKGVWNDAADKMQAQLLAGN